MTRTRICQQDGYLETHTEGMATSGKWECANPWHPRHPGPCPKCGSRRNHEQAGIGMKGIAVCRECTHQWRPFAD